MFTILARILGWTKDDIEQVLIQILTFPFYFIFLTMDAIVYSLVAYAYKLFELMSKINLSTLLTWFGPFLNRIQSLLIVIIMFTIGYALVNYLINPDKVSDNKIGGVALLKNIAIAAVLLASYQTAFEVLNESTFLVIGAPENYEYNYLKDWFGVTNDGNPGLLSNLIFGEIDESEQGNDFGTTLAVKTLSIFLHERNGSSDSILNKVYNSALNGDFSLLGITGAAFEINFIETSSVGKVEYKYPILSTIVGLYLVYTIVSIAIAIGIRAFKLILLQILAPLAIVTIIKDGLGATVWTKWYKLLGKTYVDVFLRIGSMYFVVALISVVWDRIGELFNYNSDINGFTGFLLLILVIVAGFKFAKEVPGFIDSIFGSHLAEANKSGFKDFLGTIPRLGTAAAGMVANGREAWRTEKNGDGKQLSKAQRLWNTASAATSGAKAGFGSKGDSIKKRISNISDNNNTTADNIAKRKATIRENVGNSVREFTGENRRKRDELTAQIKEADKNYEGEQMVHNEAESAEAKLHDSNVRAEDTRHTTAMRTYQAAADGYQRDINTKTEAMKQVAAKDSSGNVYTNARTGKTIKFDENYMQNMVEGNQMVIDAQKAVEVAREKLKAAIQKGMSVDDAAFKNLQISLTSAENTLAQNIQTAKETAITVKEQYEKDSGITDARNSLEKVQRIIKKEEIRHETRTERESTRHETISNTETARFKGITETHDTLVKGRTEVVRDPVTGAVQRDPVTGAVRVRHTQGLEDQLRQYGGKKQ